MTKYTFRILVFFLALKVISAAPLYNITELGSLGGDLTRAFSINDQGQIVGNGKLSSGELNIFLWENGVISSVGTLNGDDSSFGGKINNNGTIVGTSRNNTTNTSRGFIIKNGMKVELNGLSSGYGINDHDVAIGTVFGPPHVDAKKWESGIVTDLGSFLDDNSIHDASSPYAINTSGQIVGYSHTGPGVFNAFEWSNGVLTNLGTLGDPASSAHDINDRGHIVGVSTDTNSGVYNAFLYMDGQMSNLGNLGGTLSSASEINEADQIVGTSTNQFGVNQAFLWENGVMKNLNDTINDSDWVLNYATSINNSGQIVGYGTYKGLSNQAFVLSLVPEPSTYAMLVLGLIGIGVYGRRKRIRK